MLLSSLSPILKIAVDAVGDWNPQLLRELQGRLRWRNLLFAFLSSFLIQALLIGKYLV